MAQQVQLLQRGLPAGPAIASIPGTARWVAAIKQSKSLLDMVCDEMQDYHDERSETWQESMRAETFIGRMESLQELQQQFEVVID
jgi:hypothetical protein